MMRLLVMIICLSLVALPGASLAKDGGGRGVGKKSGMNSEKGRSPSDSAYEHASDKARFMRNESSSPYENREGSGDRERYEGDHDRDGDKDRDRDRSGGNDDNQQESKDKSKGKHKKKQNGEDESVEDNHQKRHEHEMEHEYHGEDQMPEQGDKER